MPLFIKDDEIFFYVKKTIGKCMWQVNLSLFDIAKLIMIQDLLDTTVNKDCLNIFITDSISITHFKTRFAFPEGIP